jgi:hypothetical protein
VRRSPSTDQPARLAARPARTPRQAALPRHDTAPSEGVGLPSEAEDARAHAEDARERLPSAAMAEARCPSCIELPLILPCFKEDAKYLERRRGHRASLKRCFAWRRGLTAKNAAIVRCKTDGADLLLARLHGRADCTTVGAVLVCFLYFRMKNNKSSLTLQGAGYIATATQGPLNTLLTLPA